jgi:hypothetical protein
MVTIATATAGCVLLVFLDMIQTQDTLSTSVCFGVTVLLDLIGQNVVYAGQSNHLLSTLMNHDVGAHPSRGVR